MSSNLNLSQMAENQASPELTHNAALAEIDASITESLTVDISAGNATVSSANYRSAVRMYVTGGTAARDVTLPAVKRLVMVHIDSSNTHPVTLIVGTTEIELQPGSKGMAYTDGSANGLETFAITVGNAGAPFDITTFLGGLVADGVRGMRINVRKPFFLPTNLAGSVVDAAGAATGTATFTFQKNGASIGTAVFSAAGTVAALTLTATAFDVGDIFDFTTPTPDDASLADVSFGLVGYRR